MPPEHESPTEAPGRSFCGCLPRHEARRCDELDQATDHREKGNGGGLVQVAEVAASWSGSFRKKLGGSFRSRRSKEKLERGRSPKEGGSGAAPAVPPSAGIALNTLSPSSGSEREVLERAGSTSPGGDSFSGRTSKSSLEVEGMANDEPPPLPLVQRRPSSAPALGQEARSTALAAATPAATPGANAAASPIATLGATVAPTAPLAVVSNVELTSQHAINDSQFAGGAGPSQSEAGPSVMNTAIPAAIPAAVERYDAAQHAGTQPEAAGSSPSQSSQSSQPMRRASTKERLQDWARTAFENGETQLSTAQVPVVEWSSLVGRRFLGSGEFCTVSSATLDGKQVAVKVLREQHRDNSLAITDLESETQIMISLRHPSILRVLGVGRTDGLPFLVLEVLDSVLLTTLPKPAEEVSVWARRRSVKAWPLQRALQCGIELAEALRYIHNEYPIPGFQLLHRDLKPDNMGFRADGSLALFDFGLAKLVRIQSGVTAHKLTGQTGATRYMAPEVSNSQPYGTSAELYSFAIILWQLVSHEVRVS